MENKNEAFTYTYSATQQEEIKRIQKKYLPPEYDKMAQLRKLDESATIPGKIIALCIGTVSALIFGVGMCCTMLWPQYFAIGIIIGVVGIVGICITYPLYLVTTKHQRQKLAPEIIRLSAELIGQE